MGSFKSPVGFHVSPGEEHEEAVAATAAFKAATATGEGRQEAVAATATEALSANSAAKETPGLSRRKNTPASS